jgi:Uma2 family endonuclease
MVSFTLNIPPLAQLTDERFYELCQANRDLKFERSAKGELIIMSPTGGETGKINSDINADLNLWNRQTHLGVVFDSSTGFKLPNGSDRSPDAAWISLEKWNKLLPEQQEQFIPLCPDFVIELRSPSDSLQTLQNKMQEYIDNGTSLGWLINRKERQVEIYRSGQEKEVLDSPNSLSGEEILPGFILNVAMIW